MSKAKRTTPKALQIEGTNNGVGESFRLLYYGNAAAGSVPFMWESQPGTPKHALTESSLPPLTPPPSYHQCSQKYNSSMHLINHRSSKISTFFSNCFVASYGKKSVTTVPVHLWQSTPMKEHAGGGSPTSGRFLSCGFKRSNRINKLKSQRPSGPATLRVSPKGETRVQILLSTNFWKASQRVLQASRFPPGMVWRHPRASN